VESANNPQGWLTEKTAVFSIELCRTLVADFESGAGAIKNAVKIVSAELAVRCQEIEDWKELNISTECPVDEITKAR
jgi:hypothetical protein